MSIIQKKYNVVPMYHYRDCLRLCFMHLIQEDLDSVSSEWNSHRIRPLRDSDCPPGHPNELYFMPQILGMEIYIMP